MWGVVGMSATKRSGLNAGGTPFACVLFYGECGRKICNREVYGAGESVGVT